MIVCVSPVRSHFPFWRDACDPCVIMYDKTHGRHLTSSAGRKFSLKPCSRIFCASEVQWVFTCRTGSSLEYQLHLT